MILVQCGGARAVSIGPSGMFYLFSLIYSGLDKSKVDEFFINLFYCGRTSVPTFDVTAVLFCS